MANIYYSKLWRQNLKKRQGKKFKYHYIPNLPTKKIKEKVFFVLGSGFLVIFLATLSYISLVSLTLNLRYYSRQLILKNQSLNLIRIVLAPVAFKTNVSGQTKYPVFGLVIPKIGVDAPVIANVDPNNYSTYMKTLKKGVAMAQGSAYPDQNGTTYIFAHSTNLNPRWISYYNAVFYLLNKLKTGDKIYLWYNYRQYSYQVSQVLITDKEKQGFLYNPNKQLVLQTCYPPGTSLRRLIVIAKPIKP